MSIISSLLKSIELYFALKNKLYYYEIIQKSKSRQKELIQEIEKLRSDGSSNSSDNADLLRNELIQEKNGLKHISTFINPTSTTSADKNP